MGRGVKLVQQPRCATCRRRFDVETKTLDPLPQTWTCGKDDCVRPLSAPSYEIGKPAASKYRNEPIVIDGHRFASKHEAKRYGALRLMEKTGQIRDLELQKRYELRVNGVAVCEYVADFAYKPYGCSCTPREHKDNELCALGFRIVVEDAKGVRTPVYQLKKKLMKACLGIEIIEV